MIYFLTMSLVNVSRKLRQFDHYQLREHIPEINRLGDLSIKWLPLGHTGCRIIERHHYLKTIQKQVGELANRDTVVVADELNQGILNCPPHNERLTVPICNVDFMGDTKFRKIAFILSSDQKLMSERERITSALDRQNGINGWWGDDFRPHVPLATIPENLIEPSILDAFWEFAPEELVFERAIAVSS